jgi:L-seryl-tRNA(Ser) seleniumtransferase
MPPEVLAAVQKAALHPVRLHDLQQKAGEYIAHRLRCEGAVVTSGASGAISLATAACLQYANNIKILDMPQAIDGMKNQVIVQRAHRYEYDRAMYLCGARVTEVVTLDDYKRACGAGNAVMTNFLMLLRMRMGSQAAHRLVGKTGCRWRMSTTFRAIWMQLPTCRPFRIYGNTPAWVLTL